MSRERSASWMWNADARNWIKQVHLGALASEVRMYGKSTYTTHIGAVTAQKPLYGEIVEPSPETISEYLIPEENGDDAINDYQSPDKYRHTF